MPRSKVATKRNWSGPTFNFPNPYHVARVISPLVGLKYVYFLQGGPLIVINGVVGVKTPTTGVMGSYL